MEQEIREVRKDMNLESDKVKAQFAKMSGNVNKKIKMIKNGVKTFVEKKINDVRKDIDGVLATFDQKIDNEVRLMDW